MSVPFKPPTREELHKIIEEIKKQFPYEATPSANPGQGETILSWMEENFGALDLRWTIIEDATVRFRTEEDKLAFVLTWNSDWGKIHEDCSHL